MDGLKGQESRTGRRAATIRDVARHAGVSRATVSRVLNSAPTVSVETRRLVESAIITLDFAPNRTARALAGVEYIRVALLHRFPNPGYLTDFVTHLLDLTADHQGGLLVEKVAEGAEHERLLRKLALHSVKAVILAASLSEDRELVDALRAAGMALVAAGSPREVDRVASVGIDERLAASDVADHLIALGHRRIGFIAGNPRQTSSALRLSGFRDAHYHANIELDQELVVSGLSTYQSGLDAAEHLLRLSRPPTAIFASDDDMAAAVVNVAHRQGIDVPCNLSVCGFGDTALATTIWPQLTTVRQSAVELTREALDMLVRELATSDTETGRERPRTVLPHELVRRATDASLPA